MAPVGLFGVARTTAFVFRPTRVRHTSAEGVNPFSGRVLRGIAFIPRRFRAFLLICYCLLSREGGGELADG